MKTKHLIYFAMGIYFGFVVTAQAVTLAWKPTSSPSCTYKLYYGPSTGSYTNSVGVGTNTTASLSNSQFSVGSTVHFSVTAVDTLTGLESAFSNEASFTVPPPSTSHGPLSLSYACQNGVMIITVTGDPGASISLQSTGSLSPAIWTGGSSGRLNSSGTARFSVGMDAPSRFFRAVYAN